MTRKHGARKNIVASLVYNRPCRNCNWWKRNKPRIRLREHQCVQNYSGSAHAKDEAAGVQGVKEFKQLGTPFEIMEGEGYSTTTARGKNQLVHSKDTKLSRIIIMHLQKYLKYTFAKTKVT